MKDLPADNNRTLNIVFVLWTLNIGGAEKQCVELVRHLDRTRFAPRVLALRHGGPLQKDFDALHVPVTLLGFSSSHGKYHPRSVPGYFKFFRKIIRYFRQEQADVVQSYLRWTNIFMVFAARIAGVPAILTGRCSILNKHVTHFPRFPDGVIEDISNLFTSRVFVNSLAVQDACLQQEHFLSPSKIRLIYNGVDPDQYSPKDRSLPLLDEWHIPDGNIVVGMIANLHRYKGHKDVLQAAADVVRTFPSFRVVFIGRDYGIRSELEGLAKTLRLEKTIIFAGERNDIPDCLSVMDILLLVSHSEAFSNAILEGMAAGIPVIATDIGGNPEQVLHEITGLLVPPEDPGALAQAILCLLQDEHLRHQMGTAARQRAEQHFHLSHMCRQFEALYLDTFEAASQNRHRFFS